MRLHTGRLSHACCCRQPRWKAKEASAACKCFSFGQISGAIDVTYSYCARVRVRNPNGNQSRSILGYYWNYQGAS
jgi:hypothetical protein